MHFKLFKSTGYRVSQRRAEYMIAPEINCFLGDDASLIVRLMSFLVKY